MRQTQAGASIVTPTIAATEISDSVPQLGPWQAVQLIPVVQMIDPRILNTSYSSGLALHSCPRKYQLNKLSHRTIAEESAANTLQQLTFDFGHMVGTGIQELMIGTPLSTVIFQAFVTWELDLLVENPKQKKSFWLGVAALQQFSLMRESGYLQDYIIVQYNGKPAAELSARITFPDGFKYRLYMDIVLRNRYTGEVAVIECKTNSGYTCEPGDYKNSSQGLGYSTILDVIEPTLSSYKVIYLIYMTKKAEWEVMEFPKTYTMRAQWIQELLLDNKMVSLYEDTGIYPKHGESCREWFRDCDYLQTCGMSTGFLTVPYDPENDPELKKTYDFEFTIEQVIEAQIKKEVV